ncbi:MAG: DNA repair protein RecN [Acidobacteria bacterium RIFCSPLOWO2_12_FULL_67_14]|nr:MAG: DNA repair protein RecN [Acidobacteria bacterium RIFCSPLOWO2_12_FULL_67_14]
MLRLLRIRNLAVIEAVDVEFEPGFNVLTGETGAGKSIVVEAVSLLLGARASADLVRTGETLATIEALFEDPSTPLGAGGEVVVRRELTNLGRSRSFINGALATAGALRELSVRLVELHGQHEHQTLLDPLSHLSILDEYVGAGELVSRVAGAWAALRTIREQVERSRMDEREKSARLDLIAFQLRELEKAVPQPGEDEALAATRQVLASADRIQRLCEESYAALYESDDAVLATLGGVWKRVSELAAIDPQFASYVEARESIKAQLDDLAFFLRSYGQGVDASPARLQDVEDRLALLERLKRKYGPTLDEVIARAQALARERELLTGEGARLEDLQAALTDAGGRYLIAARELSERRRTAAREFARKIEGVLADLAMARTRFEVRFNASELGPEAWTERGVDRGEFYVSPNPGEELRPLARIVSGGELSRLMLAIKTLALNALNGVGSHFSTGESRKNDSRPHLTLVFDEVDAGIGGRVADVVGARLAALGARFQVLCITHLPQIAARGATHFRIDKQVRSGRTITTVERLGEASRVDELARIIGGNVTSEAVRTTARELLASAAASPESGAGSRGRRRPGGEEAKGESERRKSRR